ncbi:MAG: filamentous hemagglutinin N-terminal domain-containing protein [Rhizonema sp. PD37]|nr:filamentous hemagglutinin N-terminal domain-containing protein [Rhizonema sp. PD37]
MYQLHKLLQKLFFSIFILVCAPAHAQITPDNTLGTQASRLTPNVLINGVPGNRIDGGAQRGGNLFHSFSQFNVGNGQRVYFGNPVGVENILTRVTGGNASNIFGTLGVDGAANLFLINPNGILFGQSARLDVRGSFVGTTANAIQFGNQGIFSATNPDAPPLLTVQPSALLFNQINQNAAIQNNSIASAGTDPAGFNAFGLRVPDGKSLLLVGGNVSMDRGQLNANGGRVELGGLAEGGTVLLGVDGDNLSLIFPSNVVRSDVSLTNQAGILVEGAGGGNIVVNARNLEILGGSFLSAGIGQGLGTAETVAGRISLNATREIKIAGSGVTNLVPLGSQGNGGNITIDSGSFLLQDGSQLVASTSGQGDAGNVTVRALDSISLAGRQTTIFSTVSARGVGKGGNIDINAAKVSLIDGAQLSASTSGRGNAGNVTVRALDSISLAGASIFSTVSGGGVGKGGNIDINAGTLSLIDGAQLISATLRGSNTQAAGRGDAGNVNVNVIGKVDIAGEKNGLASGIRSFVGTGTEGNGGNITIDSGSFSLSDRASLTASTYGRGNAGNVTVSTKNAVSLAGNADIFSEVGAGGVGNGGNIDINARTLSLKDGSQLSASTLGRGNAGNVTVRVLDSISLAGNANIFSVVEAGGVGKGGNIDINAATLSLTDGAQLLAITREASDTQPAGQGDAGNVNIKVTGAVDIAGNKNTFPSGIGSTVAAGTVGNGGNITIDSGLFSLQDGAQIATSTFGQGNAGNVTVRALDSISLANGNIFSTVERGSVGKGGNININAATLSLKDGAQLLTPIRAASDTQPAGRGDAGNVNVNVTGSVDIAGEKNGFVSAIISRVETGAQGNAGNIIINSGSFLLRDGASLSAETSGRGNAGNINIKVTGTVDIFGENNGLPSRIRSFVGTGTEGNGGNITIDSGSFSLRDHAEIAASTYGQGNAGNVTVRALDSISLQDGALIAASTLGRGNAGNVTVRALDSISLTGASIFSTVEAGGVGKGGNIDINAATLSLKDGAQLLTLTRAASNTQPAARGDAGNVNVKVTGSVDIAGEKNGLPSGIRSRVQTGTVGNGGNITIDSSSLLLQNGALLTAETLGQGNAGTIKVNAANFFTVSGKGANFTSGLFVNSRSTTGTAGDIIVTSPRVTLNNQAKLNAESASGNGGNIKLNSDLLLLRRGSQISTTAGTTQAGGNGGNVNINSKFIVAVPKENSDITANAFSGTGGNINIRTQGIFGIEPRLQVSDQTNDITASSELGVQGQINIIQPNVQPAQGLVELPGQVLDASNQIAQDCSRVRNAKKPLGMFIVTGRGIPPNATQPLNGTPNLTQLATLDSAHEVTSQEYHSSKPNTSSTPNLSSSSHQAIVEAQGWVKTPDGNIMLVAQAPEVIPSFRPTASVCPVSK